MALFFVSQMVRHRQGVGYEDWHFRYVGKESAEYMTEHNITLEEYLALLKEKTK